MLVNYAMMKTWAEESRKLTKDVMDLVCRAENNGWEWQDIHKLTYESLEFETAFYCQRAMEALARINVLKVKYKLLKSEIDEMKKHRFFNMYIADPIKLLKF